MKIDGQQLYTSIAIGRQVGISDNGKYRDHDDQITGADGANANQWRNNIQRLNRIEEPQVIKHRFDKEIANRKPRIYMGKRADIQ